MQLAGGCLEWLNGLMWSLVRWWTLLPLKRVYRVANESSVFHGNWPQASKQCHSLSVAKHRIFWPHSDWPLEYLN